MLRAIKTFAVVCTLFLSLLIFTVINPDIGAVLSALLAALCVLTLFKPLPTFGLSGKGKSIAILLLVALPVFGGAMSARDQQSGNKLNTVDLGDAGQRNKGTHSSAPTSKQQKMQSKETISNDVRKPKPTEPAANVAQSKAERMAQQVATSVEKQYGEPPKTTLPGGSFCNDTGFCDLQVGAFFVQIYGNGIVSIEPNTQAPLSEYRTLCATVFSGISSSDISFADETINGAFLRAGISGKFKHDIGSTQLEIKPGAHGLTSCSFFQFGP